MGLTISVLRQADGMDCTNNGISSRFERLTLVNAEGPVDAATRPDAPAVVLEQHVRGCLRIRPANETRWVMFGGNYASTSDSRFSEACKKLLGHRFYGAVAIHDRVEE